jgi:hypothetical protein
VTRVDRMHGGREGVGQRQHKMRPEKSRVAILSLVDVRKHRLELMPYLALRSD